METKQCSRCNKIKQISDFRGKKDRITKMCIKCRENSIKYDRRKLKTIPKVNDDGVKICTRCCKYKIQNHEYVHCKECRAKHKIHWNRNGSNSNNRKINFYINLKKGQKCIDCGIDDYRLLEFDHIDPNMKKNCVRRMSNIQDMKEEAEKCKVRCSRCHRIKTFKDRYIEIDQDFLDNKPKSTDTSNYHKWRRMKAKSIVENKRTEIGQCQICGWYDKNHPYCFDFDHIDRIQKNECISRLCSTATLKKLIIELEKCRLLCANCHRLYTLTQMDYMSYDNVSY